MMIRYQSLLTLQIAHSFFNGVVDDVDWLTSTRAKQIAAKSSALIKTNNGQLLIVNERDSNGLNIKPLNSASFFIGAHWRREELASVTAASSNPRQVPLFRNIDNANALSPAQMVYLSNSRLRHAIVSVERPLTIRLIDSDGDVLNERVITAAMGLEALSFSEQPLPQGLVTVVEIKPNLTENVTHYVIDEELQGRSLSALFELRLAASMEQTPANLTASFNGVSQVLKYYVVTRNYSAQEQAELNIVDNGAVDDQRPAVTFDKILPANFSDEEFPPDLVTPEDASVVLFKSSSVQPRQSAVRHKLQLRRDGDVLIQHLPHAGLGRTTADVIVYLVKT